MGKTPLIIIGGPTATGKTAVSVALAKKINGEIISADSMQIYKYMDIGTAKPTLEEMAGIPHYLIDALYPDEAYNISVFQKMAQERLTAIYQKGKLPILTGGTGFYINALIKGTDFTGPGHDSAIRQKYQQMAQEQGPQRVYRLLETLDPEGAKNIHPHNVKRVIRALEYYESCGEGISLHNEREKNKQSPYQVCFMALNMERPELYDRINRRVDKMMAAGLEREVRQLLDLGYHRGLVSMQGIGYKEIAAYLDGEWDLETAVAAVKTGSRRYAKRQVTWFSRQTEAKWFNSGDYLTGPEEFLDKMLKNIENCGILY